MSASPKPLDRLQRWMQAVITHPNGVEAGIASDAAKDSIPIESARLESIVARSRSLSSAERLAVYANAYFARLLDCLGEEFASVKYAVGDETFGTFGMAYLERYPSGTYTLSELGRNFPQFLRETRPADVAAPGWPDFLIDLATVERAYAEVFDGPGPEGRPLLHPDALDAIPAEQIPNVVLVAVPCLRILELSYPVQDYVSAVRHQRAPAPPETARTWLVITRRDFVVRRGCVSQPEYLLLRSILAGHTLAEAVSSALVEMPGSTEDVSRLLLGWFEKWSAAGWFESVRIA